MLKKKQSIIIMIIIFTILIICSIYLLLLFKSEQTKKENNNDNLTVCYAPNDCKTIDGVPKKAITNVIGYPKDFHRENSNSTVDIQAGFDKGRFDEKSFYFSYHNKVYYFINAKIFTGFSEDAGLLEKADAKTFELIDANFSKDKKHVYARKNIETVIATKKLENADPKTFTPLDWPYSKDKNNVYYFGQRLVGADSLTFKILENKLCGVDKNNYYKDGEKSSKSKCQTKKK